MTQKKYLEIIEKYHEEIYAAERYIWENPETGFKEWKTTKYLEDIFESAGYTLNRAGDIPGFYTDLDTGRPGPKILILAELDALFMPNHWDAAENGCAHACGHHAQCAAMVGIALALKEPGALDGLSGSIRLMLVPAEELIEIEYREELRQRGVIRYYGGKPEFMYRGYMDNVDIAFMFHTSPRDDCIFDCKAGSNGCILKEITYEGVAAHAGGVPHLGVNALYAASMGLQAINSLRETFIDDEHTRVHPIMTEGGTTVNVIPAKAKLSTFVRGVTMESIEKTSHKVDRALAAGALALGAKVEVKTRPGYAPFNNCIELRDIVEPCMIAIAGKENVKIDNSRSFGSTDMGDLCSVMPILQPHSAGAAGKSHGDDYRIIDVNKACVMAAQCQILFAVELLKDDAIKAKHVIENFKPVYDNKQEYFKAMDKFLTDRDIVTYFENKAEVQF